MSSVARLRLVHGAFPARQALTQKSDGESPSRLEFTQARAFRAESLQDSEAGDDKRRPRNTVHTVKRVARSRVHPEGDREGLVVLSGPNLRGPGG